MDSRLPSTSIFTRSVATKRKQEVPAKDFVPKLLPQKVQSLVRKEVDSLVNVKKAKLSKQTVIQLEKAIARLFEERENFELTQEEYPKLFSKGKIKTAVLRLFYPYWDKTNEAQTQLNRAIFHTFHEEEIPELCRTIHPMLYGEDKELKPEIRHLLKQFQKYEFREQREILDTINHAAPAAS